MASNKSYGFFCKHCNRKVFVNPQKGFSQRFHEWICHYQSETRKVKIEVENREINNVYKIESNIKRLELRYELVEKDIFGIKIDLQEADRQKIKALENIPVTPFEHDLHQKKHGDFSGKIVDDIAKIPQKDEKDPEFTKPQRVEITKKTQFAEKQNSDPSQLL